MAEFVKDQIDAFLGVVRKYMQVRGPMSQKELAVITDVGVSTMSRFINQKTTELNPQLIAKIVAKLNIPLHEMIDFVEEDYADQFIRLVKFYKGEPVGQPETNTATPSIASKQPDELEAALGAGEEAKTTVRATISTGPNKTVTIPFLAEQKKERKQMTIKEKIESLSPRQRAYLTDFLNLDFDGRDLVVDLGNSLLRYLRQKGLD